MENYNEDTFDQEEVKIGIGKFNVEMYFSDNILNMKIIETVSGLETLISLQNKEDSIKSVIWDNRAGLLSNTKHAIK